MTPDLREGTDRPGAADLPGAPGLPGRTDGADGADWADGPAGTGRPRYGPLSVLCAAVLPVAGAVAIRDAGQGAACLAVLVLLAPWGVRAWRSTLLRLGLGLLAAASLCLSTWLYGGHQAGTALAAGFRVLYLVVPAAVLTPRVDATALGDHLGQRLHLPARPVVAFTAALERLGSLKEQWRQISRARRARGLGGEGSPVARARAGVSVGLALLLATMRMSAAMALAMDARGFARAHRRTWAAPAPWQWRDSVIALGGVGLAVLPWLARLLVPAGRVLAGG